MIKSKDDKEKFILALLSIGTGAWLPDHTEVEKPHCDLRGHRYLLTGDPSEGTRAKILSLMDMETPQDFFPVLFFTVLFLDLVHDATDLWNPAAFPQGSKWLLWVSFLLSGGLRYNIHMFPSSLPDLASFFLESLGFFHVSTH